VVAHVRLAVGERRQLDLAELDAELLGEALREVRVRPPGEDHQPLLRTALDPVTGLRLPHHVASLEAWEDELRGRAAVLHTPPCSPGAGGRSRARPRERPWLSPNRQRSM